MDKLLIVVPPFSVYYLPNGDDKLCYRAEIRPFFFRGGWLSGKAAGEWLWRLF